MRKTHCPKCKTELDRIVYTRKMSEEWEFDGSQ